MKAKYLLAQSLNWLLFGFNPKLPQPTAKRTVKPNSVYSQSFLNEESDQEKEDQESENSDLEEIEEEFVR